MRLKRYQSFVATVEAGQRRIDVVQLLAFAEAISFDPREAIKLLDAYCHFAIIYHRNPLDLPVTGDAKSQATQRLLQQAAWTAVTHDPLTGLEQSPTTK